MHVLQKALSIRQDTIKKVSLYNLCHIVDIDRLLVYNAAIGGRSVRSTMNETGDAMPKIIFIEGISCAGKTTMVKKISSDLAVKYGYYVRSYLEFDSTNPIDFYCTAYFTNAQYETFCEKYRVHADEIRSRTVDAGNTKLVRYYDNDTPLFSEPILSELSEREFCWEPKHPVSLKEYSECYENVWRNWISSTDNDIGYYIFDGSLMHHPINDMMRNYDASAAQAERHIKTMLDTLGNTGRKIVYLSIDNIERQLINAHYDRGEDMPGKAETDFWKRRYANDLYVLGNLNEDKRIFDVEGRWDTAKQEILKYILT